MQANRPPFPIFGLDRRAFFTGAGVLAAGLLLPTDALSLGSSSQVDVVQLVYPGGNWKPRPSAIRRLAWEVHKRTAVDTVLEPGHQKPTTLALASSPIAYLSGDRPFPSWEATSTDGLSRFLRLGGTLIIDPAFTPDGDEKGFSDSVDELLGTVLPSNEPLSVPPGHLVFRTFYSITRAVGRREGSPGLTGHEIGGRLAVLRTDHDLGGAWARDNLGNWEHDVSPGGDRQREQAFRLGVNLVMYSLCLGYKDEQPHRRFGKQSGGR